MRAPVTLGQAFAIRGPCVTSVTYSFSVVLGFLLFTFFFYLDTCAKECLLHRVP